MLRARKKCANRPFWVEDNPEKTMYNAVGNPQEIALRKSARIRDWRAISDVHRSRKRKVYRGGVGESPFSRRGLSLGGQNRDCGGVVNLLQDLHKIRDSCYKINENKRDLLFQIVFLRFKNSLIKKLIIFG